MDCRKDISLPPSPRNDRGSRKLTQLHLIQLKHQCHRLILRLPLRRAHRRNAEDQRKAQPPRMATVKWSLHPQSAVDQRKTPTHPSQTPINRPRSGRNHPKTTRSPRHCQPFSDCHEDPRSPAQSTRHKVGRIRFFSKMMNRELLRLKCCLRPRQCPHSTGQLRSRQHRIRQCPRARHSLQALSHPAKQHRQPPSEL
jgi:hypothetical protein